MTARKSLWVLLLKAVILIGTIAVVTVLCWVLLRSRERAYLLSLTRVLARTVQTELSDEMSARIQGQARLANLLEEEPSRKEWENQARLVLADQPGFLVEQWVDATYRVRWIATREPHNPNENLLTEIDGPLKRLLDVLAHRSEKGVRLTPPFRLWNGKSGRRIVAPAYREGALIGFQIASYDEEESFGSILGGQANLGYSIAVFEDNQEIYRVHGSDPQSEKERGQDAELGLRGAQWRVRVWPKPELVRGIETTLMEMALAVGLLAGLLVFAAGVFGETVYVRSQELRRSRDQLELRIQERTAELLAANKELESEIHVRKQAEESLRDLSRRLERARDEEQKRIARELHDSTAQILGTLAFDIDRVRKLVPDGDLLKAQKLLVESTELVERATAEVRSISYLLNPPILDHLGLEGIVPWYAAIFSNRSGIEVSVDVQPELGRFSHELELALFRIMQEALTNVHRHTKSPSVRIEVSETPEHVILQVADRGRGIPPEILDPAHGPGEGAGLGIPGMRERVRQLGGNLEIVSDSSGTIIRAILPIRSAASDNPFSV